mgnify:CR=1 FL=1
MIDDWITLIQRHQKRSCAGRLVVSGLVQLSSGRPGRGWRPFSCNVQPWGRLWQLHDTRAIALTRTRAAGQTTRSACGSCDPDENDGWATQAYDLAKQNPRTKIPNQSVVKIYIYIYIYIYTYTYLYLPLFSTVRYIYTYTYLFSLLL